MYKLSKAPNGVISKRLHGLSGLGKFSNNSVRIIESISPPSGSRSPEDAARRSPSVESITSVGPRPVFLGRKSTARRGSKNGDSKKQNGRDEHLQENHQEVGTPRPDDDIVSFFETSWTEVNAALAEDTAEESSDTSPERTPRRAVVHHRPASPSMPDFKPCNYIGVWADHQYRKMITHIDMAIQQRSQNVQESKSC